MIAETVQGDLTDKKSLYKALKDIDQVIHVAGMVQGGQGPVPFLITLSVNNYENKGAAGGVTYTFTSFMFSIVMTLFLTMFSIFFS